MTIPNVNVDDPVEAATANQLIANVNSSPGRVVFTANGVFSVPDGVHKFKVYVAGGGGKGGDVGSEYNPAEGLFTYFDGAAGGRSPLASVVVSGQALGSSFAITIGAGGTGGAGGTSSFGTLLSCTGGGAGGNGTPSGPAAGAVGSIAGTMASQALVHDNGMFQSASTLRPYGAGGSGGTAASATGSAGAQGVVIVEW